MAIANLTAQRLRELLNYDPETGLFTWRQPMRKAWIKAGAQAGSLTGYGYISIKVLGQKRLAHRLAWLYMTGEWPADQVDHIDRCRTTNRWDNLRAASHKQNHENIVAHKNSSSGYPGVTPCAERPGKWLARIKHHGVHKNLGRFERVEDAIAAKVAAERALFTHSPACMLPTESL